MFSECRVRIQRCNKKHSEDCKEKSGSSIESNVMKLPFLDKTNMMQSKFKTRSGRIATGFTKSTNDSSSSKQEAPIMKQSHMENKDSADNQVIKVNSNVKKKTVPNESNCITVNVQQQRNLRSKQNLNLSQTANNNINKDSEGNVLNESNNVNNRSTTPSKSNSTIQHVAVRKSVRCTQEIQNVSVSNAKSNDKQSAVNHIEVGAENKRIMRKNNNTATTTSKSNKSAVQIVNCRSLRQRKESLKQPVKDRDIKKSQVISALNSKNNDKECTVNPIDVGVGNKRIMRKNYTVKPQTVSRNKTQIVNAIKTVITKPSPTKKTVAASKKLIQTKLNISNVKSINKKLRKRKTRNYKELSETTVQDDSNNVPIYKKTVPVLRDHKVNDIFEFDFTEERKMMKKLNDSVLLEKELNKAVRARVKVTAKQDVNDRLLLAKTNMIRNKFTTRSGRNATVLAATTEKQLKSNNNLKENMNKTQSASSAAVFATSTLKKQSNINNACKRIVSPTKEQYVPNVVVNENQKQHLGSVINVKNANTKRHTIVSPMKEQCVQNIVANENEGSVVNMENLTINGHNTVSPMKEQHLQNILLIENQEYLFGSMVNEENSTIKIHTLDKVHDSNESNNVDTPHAPTTNNTDFLYSTDNSDAVNIDYDFNDLQDSINPTPNKTIRKSDVHSNNSSPWRPLLKSRSGSHYLITNKSNLPVYNQEMVINSTLTAANTSMNNTPTKTLPKTHCKQTSLLDFFESSHVEGDKENCTLFDMNLFSPIKKSTPAVSNKRSPLKSISHNIFNVSSNQENLQGVLSSRSPLKSMQVLQNVHISNVQQDKNDMSFGFDDSIPLEENKNKPTRFYLKPKKHVLAPADDLPIITDEPLNKLQESSVIQEDHQLGDDKIVGIFDDMDETVAIPDITYTKIRQKRKYVYSDPESEDEEVSKKKKKRKNVRTYQENQEYLQWANKFNSMCEEVDQHVLHVE